MTAILTEPFRYSKNGVDIETYSAGAEVEGDVAKSAIAQKKAKPKRSAANKPAENKALNVPETK